MHFSPRVAAILFGRYTLWDEARRVLQRLGTNAAPVIPQLTTMVEEGGHSAPTALSVLASLGEHGLAIVAATARHTKSHLRLYAVGLLHYHTESSVAISALTNALRDPDPQVQRTAWFSITNRSH